jgi:hypothetical protein
LLSPWINPFRDGGVMDLHARTTLTFFEVRHFLLIFLPRDELLACHRCR